MISGTKNVREPAIIFLGVLVLPIIEQSCEALDLLLLQGAGEQIG